MTTFTQIFTDSFQRANAASLGNGWIDPGSQGLIASDLAVLAGGTTNYKGGGAVYRPTSDGNPRDGQVVINIAAGTSGAVGIYAMLRLQPNGTASTAYEVGVDASTSKINIFAVNAGSPASITGSPISLSTSYNTAHAYTLTASAVGVSPTTITMSLVDNTTSTTVASFTGTDSTAVLQSPTSGVFGMFAANAGGNAEVSSFTSYAANTGTASSISVTGPTSGTNGTASSAFTASVNGTLSSNVVLTPSDNGAGGTFTPSTVTFASGSSPANQTFTYTPAGTGSITLSFTNNGGLTNPSNITYTSGTASTTILPNNAAIVYSPGNWYVNSSEALSVNAGAYLSMMFTGSSIALNFNVTNMLTPASEIYYRIDGYEAQSPFTEASVASIITPTMPSNTTAMPWHLLEVCIKSTTETQNRWNSPSNIAVILTSITLASGASIMAPGVAPNGSILIFGDSITEGVRTVNYTAANDTDRNDAMMSWAYAQRRLLGVEVGLIGFGASGLTVTGSGNVPVFATSLESIMSGLTRSTSIPNLKLIVLNEGTNDHAASSASVTAAMVTCLNELLANYPGVPIAVMQTFGNYQTSALEAAIPLCNTPAMVHWVNTTGFFNPAYGEDNTGYHPTGPNNLGIIAPLVAAGLEPLLGTSSGRSYSFS